MGQVHGRTVRRAVAGLGVAACALAATATTALAYDADVTRTTGGIPHIKATTLADGGFGVGYAAAQDNICTLADAYLTGRGERAQYLGAGAGSANVASDVFWRSVIADGTIEDNLAKPFPEGPSNDARALARGYAAGYNANLAERGGAAGITDPRCQGAAWVRPITEKDVWLLANQLGMRASSNQYVAGFYGAQPPAPVTRRAAADAADDAAREPTADEIAANLAGTMFDPHAEPTLGSNALGIGRDNATRGNGVVLGNPHFPWAGNERFWEFHLQVQGDLDVIGASLMGSPVVNIGHNRHVAWSHTVSTGRRFTLHRLQLVPGTPTSYVYDGEAVPMRQRSITVPVQGGGSVTRTVYRSRFGRIVVNPGQGLTWGTDYAYALQDANEENLRLFDQWLAMNRADTAQELITAQKQIQGIPWVNTIGADDRGNAFYTDLSVVPNVTPAKLAVCVPAGLGQALLANRLYLLDGSKSSCRAGNDEDAVEPGILGPRNLPHTIRTDYVQNSNDSHWLTNPSAPLTGFTPLIGAEGGTQGLRTRLGNMIVEERVAGTDGLSAAKGFTLETLKASWTSYRSLGAELTLPGLRQICAANPTITVGGTAVDVTEACPILNAYDGTGKRDSAGGWLFARWFALAPNTSAAFFTVPFDPADPVHTPNTLNTSNAATITALGTAVKELRDRSIPLNASLGAVQHTVRGSDKIGIPGCNSGCYPVIGASTSGATYGQVQSGNSFVMFAEMDPETGPRAQALLTYSQSEDSTSPFYRDQTDRYSNGQWIELPFRSADITAAQLAAPVRVGDGTPDPTGPGGPMGPTGPQGQDGKDGKDGADGTNGADGADGVNGADGAKGETGAPGAPGAPGTPGAPGAKGDAGPAGANGTNGTNGTPGATGPAGPAGPKGATGPRGRAGRDATVTCRVTGNRRRVTCSVRLTSGARSASVRLSRKGRTAARRTVKRSGTVTLAGRKLARGTYTVTVVVTGRDGRKATSRLSVRV